jgi:hypothetical protein
MDIKIANLLSTNFGWVGRLGEPAGRSGSAVFGAPSWIVVV